MDTPSENQVGLAVGQTGGQNGAVDAGTLAAQAGGNPTGSPRKDGLVPHSPEAKLADRQRDRERKRRARAQGRAPVGGPDAPPLPSLARQPDATSGVLAPVPTAVPWEPGMLAGVTGEIIAAVERYQVNTLSKKAAQVPGAAADFADTVRKDAAWDVVSKSTLEATAPQVIARLMNRTGLSAEHAPELMLAGAVLKVGLSFKLLSTKLDKLIQESHSTPPPPPAPPDAPV